MAWTDEMVSERLRECLSYEPETGVFTRRASKYRSSRVGGVAGADNGWGYVQINVGGRLHRAHRLAWLYVYGVWPCGHLDHINGDRADNRIANLRKATRSQNNANTPVRVNNKCGLKGVVYAKHAKRWRARLTVDRRQIHLGYFERAEDAQAAYAAAAQKHFGEFARVQ